MSGQPYIVPANNGLVSKLKSLIPSVCGGGGFGYGGVGGHEGPVHGEVLGLVEYDSRLGGAHGGLIGGGAGHFTGGVESMRTWSDWQAHTSPIGLGGVEIPGATSVFGKQVNTQKVEILAALLNTRTATSAWVFMQAPQWVLVALLVAEGT